MRRALYGYMYISVIFYKVTKNQRSVPFFWNTLYYANINIQRVGCSRNISLEFKNFQYKLQKEKIPKTLAEFMCFIDKRKLLSENHWP